MSFLDKYPAIKAYQTAEGMTNLYQRLIPLLLEVPLHPAKKAQVFTPFEEAFRRSILLMAENAGITPQELNAFLDKE